MIPKIEQESIQDIKAFQEEKLSELLIYLNEKSAYYKRVFLEYNIDVNTIKSLEDLIKIPTTTKDQLQQFNDDFLCVPKNKIIDYVTTSGTLGNPVTFALTDNDLERLAYNEAISFACAGVGEDDVLQLMTTIDRRFMAGLAYFLGVRKLGTGIIRVGAGIPELQWDSILKFKPTYLIVVPSFLLKLIEYAEQNDIDINTSGIKGAICIGESLREQDFSMNVLSKKIKEKWDIELYSTYASTEMETAFTECSEKQGGHHHPELIIVEILDENDNPVKEGEEGELVITTLGVEAMPLVRFKTGDILKTHMSPCACGRNTLRLGPVVGRKKVDVNKEDMYWSFNNNKFVIQGVADFKTSQEFSLGLIVENSGIAKIGLDALENIPATITTTFYIKDTTTNETFEINDSPFEVDLEPGVYNDRFKLVFQWNQNELIEVGNTIDEVDTVVYFVSNTANIKVINNGNIMLIDMCLYNLFGQEVKFLELNTHTDVSIPISLGTGIYIVKLNTVNGIVNKKIIVE